MAKSTKDFTIKIGDAKPRVPLRRAAATDDETINKAVEQVAKQAAGQGSGKATEPSQPAKKTKRATKTSAKAKPAKPAPKKADKPVSKTAPTPDPELEKKLSNKRLTIDIPLYLHEALRQYNHENRTTAKDLVNDYLHQLTKTEDIRPKK